MPLSSIPVVPKLVSALPSEAAEGVKGPPEVAVTCNL